MAHQPPEHHRRSVQRELASGQVSADTGLVLIYQLFDNIVARTLVGYHLDGIAAWFPFQVHISLLEFKQYWPHPSPTLDYHWSTGNLLLAGIMWVLAFAAAARWVYLRRDL
jgi:hypothetical protein